eukprot:symbB.v1.2.007238.t1/scaffold401.1/size211429/9
MLRNMMQIGLAPDGVAYGTILDAFAKAGQPDDAIQMTEEMKENGVGVEVRHHNSILEAFVKAGKPNDAARWLLQMPQASNLQSKWKRDLAEPDAYSYSTVIGGLASEGHVSSVNALKQAMQTAGIEATPSLHEQVMRGYLAAKKPKDALRWLQDADTSGLSLNATFICCAIDVCLSNGMGDEGLRWLQRMKEVNIPVPEQGSRAVLFHISAVRVCAKAGAVDDGLDWLQKAENLGLNSEQKGKGEGVPLRPAYIALMKAFAGRSMDVLLGVLDSLEEAEGSMDYMARCELIMLLASWGSRQDALKLLTRVRQEGKLSVLLFSRAISACAKARQVDEAIFWFDEMQRAGIKPDTVAWNSIISACARDGRAAEAEMWLGEMEASGMKPDVVSYNIVINICAKSGRPQEASDWPPICSFQSPMPLVTDARSGWSQSAYRSAITSFTKTSDWQSAFYLIQEMHRTKVQSDVVMYNATVNACKQERWQLAFSLLSELEREALEKDNISFNSSMGAAKHHWPIAMMLLVEAQDQRQADHITRNTAMACCAWHLARQLLDDAVDLVGFNTVISTCEKACQWQLALALLQVIEVKPLQPDVISYSTAISACSGGQQWELAIHLMKELEKARMKATIRTYNAAIDACELAWQKALLLFDEVSEVSLQKSIITYNSTANACVKEEQWQLALSLLDKLPEARIPQNIVTFGISISAFEKGKQWQHALWTLFEVGSRRLNHSLVAVNAAITACEKCEKWQHALLLLAEIWRFGVQANVISCSAAIRAANERGRIQCSHRCVQRSLA